jgi:uncharacterized protein involved in exopolysaccharide biosynthesis
MQNLYRQTVVRRGLIESIFDHKGKIAAVWILLLVTALVYTSFAERRYVSEAKLFVRLGRESVKLDPTAMTGQTLDVHESRDGEINSLFELLGSRVILESIVDKVGEERILEGGDADEARQGKAAIVKTSLEKLDRVHLNPFHVYSRRDKAIKELKNNLKISRPHETHLLVLEYESPDPELSQDVLSALIEAGREAHLRVHVSPGSHQFFDKQAEYFEVQLTQQENELNAFKNENGIADLARQQDLHLTRIGALQEERSRAQASLESAEAELAQRQTALKEMPETVVVEETEGMPAVVNDRMREQLYELEIQEKELLSRYQPDHFLVKQVQNQIAMAREVMEKQGQKLQTRRGVNETRRVLELSAYDRQAVAAGLKAQIAALDAQIVAAEQEVVRLNESQLEIARRERSIGIANNNYLTHMANLEQARIDDALEAAQYSNLSVLQPPSHSVTPTSPDLAINAGLAVLLASLVSLGIVLLSERHVVMEVPVLGREEAVADGHPIDPPSQRRPAAAPGNPR